jgi:glycosyltransferase involved in cell wall biosynthesis
MRFHWGDIRLDGAVDSKLTVAHFMPWSGIGGVEIATLRMTEATKERVRNVAFCLEDAHELRGRFEGLGVETVTYAAPEPSLRHWDRYYKASQIIARNLKDIKTNVVHFSDEKAAYHNSLAALLARTRNICHLRVTYTHLSLRQRLCLLPVRSFIFVSREAKESFPIALAKDRARVVYDAVEVPESGVIDAGAAVRAEFNVPAGSPLIGMVARVSPQKDYFTLAVAACDVLARHPEARFLVVGDNSLVDLNRRHYAEVAEKLKELGISDKFIFTGHRDDVSRLISVMDICVLCTHREGFPLSILECMAMRRAVVATEVGGIPEIVKSGVNGYLHQHGDSKELADIFVSLIEDPEKTRQMGLSACEHVRQHYALARYVDEMSAAYNDVMR